MNDTVTGAATANVATPEPALTPAPATLVDAAPGLVAPTPVVVAPADAVVHQTALAEAKKCFAAGLAWLEAIPTDIEHEFTALVDLIKAKL